MTTQHQIGPHLIIDGGEADESDGYIPETIIYLNSTSFHVPLTGGSSRVILRHADYPTDATRLEAAKQIALLLSRPLTHDPDFELDQVMCGLPYEGNGDHHLLNARVNWTHRDGRPYLQVYPSCGGWLGVHIDRLDADVAPFAG